MHLHSDRDINTRMPFALLKKYVLYYNVVFPRQDMFAEHYTLMPDACGTLSIGYNGTDILAELCMEYDVISDTLYAAEKMISDRYGQVLVSDIARQYTLKRCRIFTMTGPRHIIQ